MVGPNNSNMKGDYTMINMKEVIANVTLTKVCSIKPDKDSDEHKTITLRVKFDGATVQSIFDKALSGAVIQWQNGVGRKRFDTFKNNQTIDIQFNAPASRTAVDPVTAMIQNAEAEGITVEEYLKREIAKRKQS